MLTPKPNQNLYNKFNQDNGLTVAGIMKDMLDAYGQPCYRIRKAYTDVNGALHPISSILVIGIDVQHRKEIGNAYSDMAAMNNLANHDFRRMLFNATADILEGDNIVNGGITWIVSKAQEYFSIQKTGAHLDVQMIRSNETAIVIGGPVF